MKKILASILAFAVSSTILCSCSEAEDDDRDEFRSENESKIQGIIGDEEDDEEKGVGVKLPSSNDFDVSYEIEFGDRIRNASSNSDAFLELIKSDSITFETYITLDGEVTYSSLSTSAGGSSYGTYAYEDGSEMSVLYSDEKTYILNHDEKTYHRYYFSSLFNTFMRNIINTTDGFVYDKTIEATINGKSYIVECNKNSGTLYGIVFDDHGNAVALIHNDKTSYKLLPITVTPNPEQSLFSIPSDYRMMTDEELVECSTPFMNGLFPQESANGYYERVSEQIKTGDYDLFFPNSNGDVIMAIACHQGEYYYFYPGENDIVFYYVNNSGEMYFVDEKNETKKKVDSVVNDYQETFENIIDATGATYLSYAEINLAGKNYYCECALKDNTLYYMLFNLSDELEYLLIENGENELEGPRFYLTPFDETDLFNDIEQFEEIQ